MGNSLGILNRIATFLASARESIGSVAHQAAGRGEPAMYEDCGRPARSDVRQAVPCAKSPTIARTGVG